MKKTDRGFNIYSEFKDYDGSQIDVLESSLATKKACRIYVYGGNAGDNDGAMHLTEAQARRLIKALERFLNTHV